MAPLAFDLVALAAAADPYPILAAMRAVSPVCRLENGFWAVTGYDAAMAVLVHRGCSSSPIGVRYQDGLPPGAARDEMSRRINFLEPADHQRVRSLVSKAFTPRRIGELAPWIAATADRLLDGLDGLEHLDLLARFAHQVPSLVISELLGVPIADRDRLTAWSDAVAPLLGLQVSDADRECAIAAAEEMHAYLGALLDDRRRQPGADLLSALLAAEESGQRLDRPELLSLAATLYSAGHRTTRDLFANGMSVLLSDPARFRHVVEGRWSVPDVVEEFLRYETPTLFVVRVPIEPVTIAGIEVGAWEPLLVWLSAANRDPATFDDPDQFRPGRGGVPSLSFAHGAHFCLGASLARAEAQAMLTAVARRWPSLRAAPDHPYRWHLRGPFRGLDALVVEPRGPLAR